MSTSTWITRTSRMKRNFQTP